MSHLCGSANWLAPPLSRRSNEGAIKAGGQVVNIAPINLWHNSQSANKAARKKWARARQWTALCTYEYIGIGTHMSTCPLGQMVDNWHWAPDCNCKSARQKLKDQQLTKGRPQVVGSNFGCLFLSFFVTWTKCPHAAVRDCHCRVGRVANKIKWDIG